MKISSNSFNTFILQYQFKPNGKCIFSEGVFNDHRFTSLSSGLLTKGELKIFQELESLVLQSMSEALKQKKIDPLSLKSISVDFQKKGSLLIHLRGSEGELKDISIEDKVILEKINNLVALFAKASEFISSKNESTKVERRIEKQEIKEILPELKIKKTLVREVTLKKGSKAFANEILKKQQKKIDGEKSRSKREKKEAVLRARIKKEIIHKAIEKEEVKKNQKKEM